jgi:hypothetical protein
MSSNACLGSGAVGNGVRSPTDAQRSCRDEARRKVIDQTQLHVFIARFEELGLELLSVEQVSEPE